MFKTGISTTEYESLHTLASIVAGTGLKITNPTEHYPVKICKAGSQPELDGGNFVLLLPGQSLDVKDLNGNEVYAVSSHENGALTIESLDDLPVSVSMLSSMTGTSETIALKNRHPFSVGFAVVLSDTATYSIEHSFDGDTWFTLNEFDGATSSADGYYAYPIKYLRLNVKASTGDVTLTTLQGV